MRAKVHKPEEGFGAGRRARERAAREAAVLEAAERVIGRSGFHAAGMVEIAREAEYAVGTLYNLFPSKEALYERLLLSRAEELARAVADCVRQPGSARARLEAALDAKIDFFARHIDFVRLYGPASVFSRAALDLPEPVARMRETNVKHVEALLSEAEANGELAASARPEDLAVAFQALSTAFLIAAIRGPGGIDPARIRGSMREVFFDPIFGPSRAAAAPIRVARRATKRKVRR